MVNKGIGSELTPYRISGLAIGLWYGTSYQYVEWYEEPIPEYGFIATGQFTVLAPKDNISSTIDREKFCWRRNNLIGIKLDLEKRNVEYFIDDQSIGIPFVNIPIGSDIKYMLIITMRCSVQNVILIDFEYLQ